jgi:hypothetical protein
MFFNNPYHGLRPNNNPMIRRKKAPQTSITKTGTAASHHRSGISKRAEADLLRRYVLGLPTNIKET